MIDNLWLDERLDTTQPTGFRRSYTDLCTIGFLRLAYRLALDPFV
jgi:hypothetical protein